MTVEISTYTQWQHEVLNLYSKDKEMIRANKHNITAQTYSKATTREIQEWTFRLCSKRLIWKGKCNCYGNLEYLNFLLPKFVSMNIATIIFESVVHGLVSLKSPLDK